MVLFQGFGAKQTKLEVDVFLWPKMMLMFRDGQTRAT